MSPSVTVDRNLDLVTVINVFRVRDGRQAEAQESLAAVNARIAQEPGFIFASVHRSFDGERVANYARWRTRETIVAALRHPALEPLLAALADVGEGDWHLYEVVAIEASPASSGRLYATPVVRGSLQEHTILDEESCPRSENVKMLAVHENAVVDG